MENKCSNDNSESQASIQQKSTYRIEGGTHSTVSGNVEYGVTTNSDQGIVFYDTGNSDLCVNKTSKEVVGHYVEEGIPAKIIYAKNGDVEIRAPRGQITLLAKSIRIVAEDVDGEITMNSAKTIQTNSPNFNVQGTNATIATTNKAQITSAFVQTHGENSVETSEGPDEQRTSFLGKILDAITRFKNFFNSICG